MKRTNSTDFTKDIFTLTDNIEIKTREDKTKYLALKDIRPTGSLFYANYSLAAMDATWAEGSVTHTAIGSAAITVDQLNLANDALDYVSFEGAENTPVTRGSLLLDILPNYVGTPVTDQVFYADGDLVQRRLRVFHRSSDGLLVSEVYDSNGNKVFSNAINFSPDSTSSYLVEVSFDTEVALGEKGLWTLVNREEFASIGGDTGNKLEASVNFLTPMVIFIGTDLDAADTSNFYVNYLAWFSEIKNIIAYTDPLVISDTLYVTTEENCLVESEINAKFLEDVTITQQTLPVNSNFGGILQIDGINKYWDATTGRWQISDGTLAQANDLEALTETNYYHATSKASTVNYLLILQSTDGFSTPEIELVDIAYEFILVAKPQVNRTLIYGRIEGTDQKQRTFRVTAKLNAKDIYDEKVIIYPEIHEAITDSTGYFEIDLPDTESMSDLAYYTFSLLYDNVEFESKTLRVPKVQVIGYETLTFETLT